MGGKFVELDKSGGAEKLRAEEHYQQQQQGEDVFGRLEAETQGPHGSQEEDEDWARVLALDQCSSGGTWGENPLEETPEDEMNVYGQRRRYHGDFGDSTPYLNSSSSPPQPLPLPSEMAFQQFPDAGGNGQYDGQSLDMCDSDEFGQDLLNDMEVQQVTAQQHMLSRGDGGPSYIGGRFRTFGPMAASTSSSWHQPVVTEDYYSSPPQAHPQRTPSMFANPAPPPERMSAFGSYENGAGPMVLPSVPYYHNNQLNPVGPPSGNFFMGPTASQEQQQQQQRHFPRDDLSERRAYASGSHLSIMASNLNPPDHMLHIYPSNSANR